MVAPGGTVVMREVFRERTWALRPMTVVCDDADLIALWLPRDTRWKRPRAADGGPIRLPDRDWTLVDDVWRDHDALHLIEPGAAHAVLAFWRDGGAFAGWYVNLQEPLRRTASGFDYFDHALDIVVAPDLSRWEWKDEHDLAEGVRTGVFGEQQAAGIRAEGERVIAAIEQRARPFADGWEAWRPDPSWAVPVLQ